MSDQNLTLLQQAQEARRKQLDALRADELTLGATTDGQTAEASLVASRTWKNGWGVRAYVKALFGPEKPKTEAGAEITKRW